jgi:hypothetical protein
VTDLPDHDPVALVAHLILQIEQETAERVAENIHAGRLVPASVRMAEAVCETAAALLREGKLGRG